MRVRTGRGSSPPQLHDPKPQRIWYQPFEISLVSYENSPATAEEVRPPKALKRSGATVSFPAQNIPAQAVFPLDMSDESKIEWTDATWNPVRGCTKISPGCKHCYAEVVAERFRGVRGHPYERGFDLRLVPEKLDEPHKWRTPRMIFVNSMSDLFHEAVPDDYIAGVACVSCANRVIAARESFCPTSRTIFEDLSRVCPNSAGLCPNPPAP
jgi:hypothetical protein